jgi:hypothetical protein
MQNEKKVTPTEPGIRFTGNTKTGDFIYQVIIAPHSPLSQDSLEEFYRWKTFADCSKSLGLLLRFYFQYLTESDGNLKHEEKEELMLMVMFLSGLAEDDFKRTLEDRDELLEESLKR